ncbi:MAG: TolC family protein [Bacteroidales bacterium]|nr:TolC family protein [Bacteroidales bacterium]
MMKLIKTFVFSAMALSCSMAWAQQEAHTLTLDQACDYALQHNKSLLNARDQVTSSKYAFREARAQGLPQIDGGVDFMTYFNYELNFSFGGGGEPPVIDHPDFDAGDRVLAGYLAAMMGGSSEPIVMDNQMSASGQVSQLIFNGQYWIGLQTAKIARRLADQNVVMNELDVKESITNSYIMTLITEQNLKIIGENLRNLNTMLEHTTNMYKAGVAEKTDVDQLKITVSQLKNSQKSLERAVQLNYNMLRFQLGVAPDASIKLADNIEQLMTRINPQVALDPAFNVANNINYQMMESQTLISKKQVDMRNWAYAPTIAGFYSYTKKILTTGFDMTPNHLAGITATVPIFSSGMRKAQLDQAKINLDMAQRNQEMVKEQLEIQKNQLLFNYESAFENYNTQKENVEVAGRVLKSIQNKYREGLVSSLDLTQANTNYLTAESNYMSALMTLLQAQTALEKLYNTI